MEQVFFDGAVCEQVGEHSEPDKSSARDNTCCDDLLYQAHRGVDKLYKDS